MPVDYTELEEGASISSAGITSSFDNIRAEVNDLDEASVEKRTLHGEHLPSTVVDTCSNELSGTDYFVSDGNKKIGAAASLSSGAFEKRYPGWNSVGGWAVVISASFPTVGVTLGTPTVPADMLGVLILANVNIKHIDAMYGGVDPAYHPSYLAVLAIQVYDSGSGAWIHIPRTERYVDMDTMDDDDFTTTTPKTASSYAPDITGKDVAIRTFVKAQDAEGATITQVRLVISVGSYRVPTTTRGCSVIHRQANISAMALQAEEIS